MTTTDTDIFTVDQLTHARSLEFVRLLCCLKGDDGNPAPRSLSDEYDLMAASARVLAKWPNTLSADLFQRRLNWSQKSAINPGTTLDPSWAGALSSVRPLITAFVDLARPQSLIGKLLPASRRTPFNVSVPVATAGGTFRWVGPDGAKPTGNMSLDSITIPVAKASGVLVLSDELAKLSGPGSEVAVRSELVRGMSAYLDAQFTDPAVAEVVGTSPASITNAAPSIASAGPSAANAASDLKKLIETFTATNPNAHSMAILMSPGQAVAAAVATNAPQLGPNGGSLFGVPVHTGQIGSRIVILDPSALLIGDDDGLDITVSRHAMLEMSSTPTSPAVAATVLVSLWQKGLVGFKVDRFVSWQMARADSVLYMTTSWT